jgi:hypothetical protein
MDVAYAMLLDRARARDDVMELQRMWVQEPEHWKPLYVEALQGALVEEPAPLELPNVPGPVPSDLPASVLPEAPREGPGTDMALLAHVIDMANRSLG